MTHMLAHKLAVGALVMIAVQAPVARAAPGASTESLTPAQQTDLDEVTKCFASADAHGCTDANGKPPNFIAYLADCKLARPDVSADSDLLVQLREGSMDRVVYLDTLFSLMHDLCYPYVSAPDGQSGHRIAPAYQQSFQHIKAIHFYKWHGAEKGTNPGWQLSFSSGVLSAGVPADDSKVSSISVGFERKWFENHALK